MVPSLPLLSCESSLSVKENPDRKKYISVYSLKIVFFFTDSHTKGTKSTNFHQYLNCNSSRPEHIKNSVVCSQIPWLGNICFSEKNFKKDSLDINSWFLESRYSEKMPDLEL